MLCLRFTAGDLLRTKFAAEPAPLLELMLALAVLQRHDALFERWRRRGRAVLPAAAAPVLELVEPSAECPDFLHPITGNVEHGLDTVLSTPRALVNCELTRFRASPFTWALRSRDQEAWTGLTGAVRSAHQALLADQWPRIQAGYQAEVGLRAGTFAQGGVCAVLDSIHPGVSWAGDTLRIPRMNQQSIDLEGRGVTLMPSVLWQDLPLTTNHPDGSLLVIYSAATPLPLLTGDLGGSSLAALLGTTRAAILASAAAFPTTTELARQAGVSAASASEHAKVLRQCGLITTTRDGKAVRHALTSLGDQLLIRGRRAAPSR